MFLKKKGPIDVPGGLILLPMFAAHPYNHFCTKYPPRAMMIIKSNLYLPNYKGHNPRNKYLKQAKQICNASNENTKPKLQHVRRIFLIKSLEDFHILTGGNWQK